MKDIQALELGVKPSRVIGTEVFKSHRRVFEFSVSERIKRSQKQYDRTKDRKQNRITDFNDGWED